MSAVAGGIVINRVRIGTGIQNTGGHESATNLENAIGAVGPGGGTVVTRSRSSNCHTSSVGVGDSYAGIYCCVVAERDCRGAGNAHAGSEGSITSAKIA